MKRLFFIVFLILMVSACATTQKQSVFDKAEKAGANVSIADSNSRVKKEYGGWEADISAATGMPKFTAGTLSWITSPSGLESAVGGGAYMSDILGATNKYALQILTLPADPGADRYLKWDDSETGAEVVWGSVVGTGDLLADGTVPLTANWDVGAFTIRGTQFISDIAIGTAPFVVTSTTVVTNLNADLLDGESASAFQDADAELSALAGLASAANAIPYFTGSGTAGVISSSANMVSLLGSADYATARTNLGLVIGTDVLAPNGNGSQLTNLPAQAPTNITPVDTADENLTFYLILVDGATGSQATETDAGISYNPSTNILTLTGIPVGPASDPTTDNQFARKAYVDSVVAGGGLPTTGGTMTGNITLDDGVTDSPSVIFIDQTNETATFTKLDSGYITLTTVATDGLNLLTGNLKIGNGVPGQTINGEDTYIEGLLEVDGIIYADGGVTGNLTGNASGSAASITGDLDPDQLSGDSVDDNLIAQDIIAGIGQQATAGYIQLFEASGNGTNFWKWLMPDAVTNNLTFTYPNADPTAGQVMSWGVPAANVSTGAWITPTTAASTDTFTNKTLDTAGTGNNITVPLNGVFDGAITDPADADDMTYAKSMNAATITDIYCIAEGGGTITLTLQECDAAGANCGNIENAITCDSDGAEDDGTLADGAFAANGWIRALFSAPTGTVNSLAWSVKGTQTW